ncbi:MAG: F0F1 ATP synthase subunit delta [Sulfuricellaceae bacterium]|nr:F0F1 ATP synthase subunit delta [Sulfuricellaceae bacterium]
MAETVTIARPYAEALYRLAIQGKTLKEWSSTLEALAAVAGDASMREAIANPKFTHSNIEQVFFGVLGEQLDEHGKNLVRLLLENGRLAVLPVIAEQFEKLKAEQSGELDAEIDSAFPLTDEQVKEMVGLLEKRFGRKVMAQVKVDPELIGGVKINAGDVVIDASVRGQLHNMAFALKR